MFHIELWDKYALFISHRLGGMDVRNEEARTYKNEDTDDKCGCVDEQECLDIYLGGSLAYVISCRVERYKTGVALQ